MEIKNILKTPKSHDQFRIEWHFRWENFQSCVWFDDYEAKVGQEASIA